MTGERSGSAGGRDPSQGVPRGARAEAGFTSSSGTFVRVSNANKERGGQERLEAAPSRVKYLRRVSRLSESQLPRG